MNWHTKLKEYFPEDEMKAKKHFEYLLNEESHIYHLDESEHYVVLYAEYDSFIFIDYLFVSNASRSKGIGKKILDKYKQKNKTIILEAEPPNIEDLDCGRRLRFYKRESFKHANQIYYAKKAPITGEIVPLEILYWTRADVSQKDVFEKMKKVYQDIHINHPKGLYKNSHLPTEKVVQWNVEGKDLFADEKTVLTK